MAGFTMAHAHASDWTRAAKACVDQLGDAGKDANLGFLYVTDSLAGDLSAVLAFLRETSGIEDWVGTVGLGVCATAKEYFDEPALAVLAAALPRGSFRVFPAISDSLDQFTSDNGEWIRQKQPAFGIVHGDPRNPRTPQILDALADETRCFLVGGLTSSSEASDHCVQIAGRVTDGGLSGVLFSPDVAVATGLTQGCSPIGPPHTITEAQENVLFTIDGRPALEVLKEDMGETLARDLGQAAGTIHAALPVVGSDTGDYLVRNLIGIDPESGWLAIGEDVDPGQTVMFVRRDAQGAEDDLARMLGGLKRRVGGTPRGGVYYSCVARGPNLFGENSEELGAIRRELGEFPIVGFFCNGEISHNRLYGYTGVLALFL